MEGRKKQIHAVTQGLRIIFKGLQTHSRYIEKSCGLSSAKLWMLHEIAAAPGVKVSELASSLSIHPSTCSNMLDKLEGKQLICRDRSKTDQRKVHIYVSEEGQRFLLKAPKPAQGQLSNALEKISSSELSNLESALNALILALQVKDDQVDLTPIIGE